MYNRSIGGKQEVKELLSELVNRGLLDSNDADNDTSYKPTISAKYKMNQCLIELSSFDYLDDEKLLLNSSIMTLLKDGVTDLEHSQKLSVILSEVFKQTCGFPKTSKVDTISYHYYENRKVE